MFVLMLRNTETAKVEQVCLSALTRQEAAAHASRIADRRFADTGIFHRVQDLIEVSE
jgi:hypothetical protein